MEKFTKAVYGTIDGKCFEDYNEATKHEATVLETVKVESLAIALSKFCQSRTRCSDCPFSKEELTATKENGLYDCMLLLEHPANWAQFFE